MEISQMYFLLWVIFASAFDDIEISDIITDILDRDLV